MVKCNQWTPPPFKVLSLFDCRNTELRSNAAFSLSSFFGLNHRWPFHWHLKFELKSSQLILCIYLVAGVPVSHEWGGHDQSCIKYRICSWALTKTCRGSRIGDTIDKGPKHGAKHQSADGARSVCGRTVRGTDAIALPSTWGLCYALEFF